MIQGSVTRKDDTMKVDEKIWYSEVGRGWYSKRETWKDDKGKGDEEVWHNEKLKGNILIVAMSRDINVSEGKWEMKRRGILTWKIKRVIK